MCGRFALGVELSGQVREQLGVRFEAAPSGDIPPTQTVACLASDGERLYQLNTHWGIKPGWAKRLIINAQAETVANKKTFARAFAERRCLVPCSGWYEWRDEGESHKQKYYFSRSGREPLYMAGIWFPAVEEESSPALVTLTTQPTTLCAQYHNRMPQLIWPEEVTFWFGSAQGLTDPWPIDIDSDLAVDKAPRF